MAVENRAKTVVAENGPRELIHANPARPRLGATCHNPLHVGGGARRQLQGSAGGARKASCNSRSPMNRGRRNLLCLLRASVNHIEGEETSQTPRGGQREIPPACRCTGHTEGLAARGRASRAAPAYDPSSSHFSNCSARTDGHSTATGREARRCGRAGFWLLNPADGRLSSPGSIWVLRSVLVTNASEI